MSSKSGLTKNLDIRSGKRLISQRFYDRFTLYRIKSFLKIDKELVSTVTPYKENGTLKHRAKPYSEDYDIIYKNHPLIMMAKSEVLLSHRLVLALLRHKWNSLGRFVYYFVHNMLSYRVKEI
ncbi:hypothetical protein DICVIV_12666 [Dictyocaulus viviparus]|uniref:Uncharacterized protein n=1 Tax=Dictyocaulus viviparus TaxID=29172 RepID=A0A0D8X9U3_DICVI|nr:hypothetical protein DICVIV_12666 [Dictyocaulus viviparus]